ncbi:MAG: DNA replication/repair protein RecF [Woeseiaceae bacterium]|nr:DNA replication/repair protein RecF [Woeseiaceae bacterium]
MPLEYFQCADFRCLESVELELDPHYNLICGPNASGKTSLLEAVAYLGRGRSFRGAATDDLVRHQQQEFVLFGRIDNGNRRTTAGVRNGRRGLEIHIDGERVAGAAQLAEVLPLQVLDPDIHDLVAAGPEGRRRYVDWIAFHVEQGYLDQWRRFRRALKQRNAALKEQAGDQALQAWDREFIAAAVEVQQARERVLAIAGPVLEEAGERLLGAAVTAEYRQGWTADAALAEVLADGLARDRQLGSTQSGPQRADLLLHYDQRRARRLVSRGQQKLLASAMILAASEVVQTHLERPLLLLLDDPAAELDSGSLGRLMEGVAALGCQVLATALAADAVRFPQPPRLFHVERGSVSEVS